MFRDIILVFSGLAVLIVGVLCPQEKIQFMVFLGHGFLFGMAWYL